MREGFNKRDAFAQVNDTLNSCAFDADSCVSTSNDDKKHFTAPWSYDGDRIEAVDRLVAVATGLWRRRLAPLPRLPDTGMTWCASAVPGPQRKDVYGDSLSSSFISAPTLPPARMACQQTREEPNASLARQCHSAAQSSGMAQPSFH